MADKKRGKENDDDVPSFPPEGEEGKDPNTAAREAAEAGKSDETKALEAAANQRSATGGQSGFGSAIPGQQGAGDPNDTMTADELKSSKQPGAPEKPLGIPDAPKDDDKKK